MDNQQAPEITEVTAMKPISDANVAAVAEAASDQVVVSRPKKGLGLAAFFTRNKQTEVEEQMYESSYADVKDAGPVSATVSQQSSPEESDLEPCEPIPPHKNGRLKQVLECMLFVSDGPLTVSQLAQTLVIEEATILNALNDLERHLESNNGLRLMRVAGGFQLCTSADYAEYCTMLLTPAKKKLSKAALETLAVVAYRQPCTMPEVEAVRGVAVDGVMRTLCERGLVKEAGRKQTPGRPILYATTPEFLEYFGLNDLSELPDIDMLAVEEVKALEAQRELFTGEAEGGMEATE